MLRGLSWASLLCGRQLSPFMIWSIPRGQVERVRLLSWGDSIGLQSVLLSGSPSTSSVSPPAGEQNPTLSRIPHPKPAHPRLAHQEVRDAVIRVLGCIQHVFEDTNRLQERYGLQPAKARNDNKTRRSRAERCGRCVTAKSVWTSSRNCAASTTVSTASFLTPASRRPRRCGRTSTPRSRQRQARTRYCQSVRACG
ncbi:hypothetical protein VTJ83DRAFT_4747 [Remersonia thermophila]|uniref:Prion-inhibition and propagation HeLo domain-containing protein n=1 Tax=Remersonia thermophila TaxID=72144 RepID=A0ABR4DAV1_9PEZI